MWIFVDLNSFLGVRSVADVVRNGRLRWLGHWECESVDDWVLACRNVVVEDWQGWDVWVGAERLGEIVWNDQTEELLRRLPRMQIGQVR